MTRTTLSRAELSTRGAWVVLPAAASDIERYRELTGAAAPMPAGLAVAVARRAFSDGRPLPAGGVLLGLDVVLGDWDAVGPAAFRCASRERTDSAGRVVVTIEVDLRSSTAGRPTTVVFVIRWPEEASDG